MFRLWVPRFTVRCCLRVQFFSVSDARVKSSSLRNADSWSQRKALQSLIKTKAFKDAYKLGYTQNEQGQDINEGIEMIKDVISEYRGAARKEILETKAATDYVDSDGNNIYNILKEREDFSERPESLLESLNLK